MLLVGVGDGGIQTLQRIHARHPLSVPVLLANTEGKSLQGCSLDTLLLGEKSLRGLGTAGDTELAWQAAEEAAGIFTGACAAKKVILFFACLGGGTGSGALPNLVRQAHKTGAMVIVFICTPFAFLGKKQAQNAHDAVEQLKAHAHGIITLPNDLLLSPYDNKSIEDSFLLADAWVYQSIISLSSMLEGQGFMKIDWAIFKRVFSGEDPLIPIFAVGSAKGEMAQKYAVDSLLKCPLLRKKEVEKIEGLLIYIIGGKNLGMGQVNAMVGEIHDKLCNPDETVLGAAVSELFVDEICVCVMSLSSANPISLSPGERTIPAPIPELILPPESRSEKAPVHRSKRASDKKEENSMIQDELFLEEEISQTTLFDNTSPSLINGVNYDIPTFLRQGIKLHLN